MKKPNEEKKNKKDVYVIVICLIFLVIVLLAFALNKKDNKPEEHKEEKMQEVEKEKENDNNKFAGYELNDQNFRKDTNKELQVLFDKEDINEDDVIKLSNSLVKGYLYLLEKRNTGTIYMKDLTTNELGVITAEFLYTTQNKICTDMSFLEELISLLFYSVDVDLEMDEAHFNEYNNSYCLDREVYKYKYHLVYNDYSYTKDYITISYKKIIDNQNKGLLKVYFKNIDNRFYLEKIDL